MADTEDKDVNVESGSDMGFGRDVDLGNVNVGAAFDRDAGGLGSGGGLSDDHGPDLSPQVAMGGSGPGFGSWSKSGAAVGGLLSSALGLGPLGSILGGFGPGLVNSLSGNTATMNNAAAFGGPASSPAAAAAQGTASPTSGQNAAAALSGAPSSSTGNAGLLGGLGDDNQIAQLYKALASSGLLDSQLQPRAH